MWPCSVSCRAVVAGGPAMGATAMRMRERMIILVLVLAAGLLPGAALAEQPGAEGALAAAGRTPVDADMVLVIQNATELRRTALAEIVGSLFEAAGPEGDPRQAWRGLAAELGWGDDEAFDRLLGGRMMLVARGIDNPETARWALLSQVTRETDQKLKQRLKAAPRGIAQGQQVLAIEEGRFELTSARRKLDPKSAARDEREITVLLAPTGRSELLDAMLAQITGGDRDARLLRDLPVAAEAARLGEPEILLLARLGERAPAGPGDAWPDYLILSAARHMAPGDAGRWSARLVLRERSRQKELLAAGVASDAVFNALQDSSLLTIVQMAPLATIFGPVLPFDDPLTKLPWPARAAELFTGRQAIRVHAVAGAENQAAAGLACTLAMETIDGARLAAVLDPSIAQFFMEVERAAGQRGETTAPLPDFAGIAPQAVRTLSIELGSAGPLAGVTGPGLTAAWAFPSTGQGDRAWWTLAMSGPGGAAERARAAVRDAAAAVGGGGGGRESRWIWLMSSRPRELEAILAPGVPDIRGLRSFMRRISDLGCRLSITEQGDIEGELTIRLFEGEGR